MYMFLGLGVIFYSLWAVDPQQSHKKVIWTVPIVMIITMAYSLSVEENDSDGDPINILTKNKLLIVLLLGYGLLMMGLVYIR